MIRTGLSLVVVQVILLGCPAGGSESDEAGTSESGTSESSTGESSTGESGTGESSTSESSTGESSTSESGTSESSTSESSTSESSTGESESETGGVVVPGECVQELEEAGPDEFVGDGIPDANLRLRLVNAPAAPIELEVGRRIHIQGSYWWALLCGDDDIACNDSFVIRSYPDERFVLAQVHGAELNPVLLDALGIDADTWMRPFTLGVQDDMLCSWELGVCQNPNIITRRRLYVDAGVCETAALMDDSQGYFGQLYFVSVDELEFAEGGTLCVDDQTRVSVLIAKQPCEGDACPPTADVFECPPNDQVQDEATLTYDGGWEPPGVGVDLVCEVLDASLQGNELVHALDCGPLAP